MWTFFIESLRPFHLGSLGLGTVRSLLWKQSRLWGLVIGWNLKHDKLKIVSICQALSPVSDTLWDAISIVTIKMADLASFQVAECRELPSQEWHWSKWFLLYISGAELCHPTRSIQKHMIPDARDCCRDPQCMTPLTKTSGSEQSICDWDGTACLFWHMPKTTEIDNRTYDEAWWGSFTWCYLLGVGFGHHWASPSWYDYSGMHFAMYFVEFSWQEKREVESREEIELKCNCTPHEEPATVAL